MKKCISATAIAAWKRVILWYMFLQRISQFLRACQGLSGLVGTCGEFVESLGLVGSLSGVCREFVGSLSGVCREFVGSCRELWGMWILWNLTLRESQLWSIKFWPNSLFLRFYGVSWDSEPWRMRSNEWIKTYQDRTLRGRNDHAQPQQHLYLSIGQRHYQALSSISNPSINNASSVGQ